MKITCLESISTGESEKNSFRATSLNGKKDISILSEMNVLKKKSTFFVFCEFHHEGRVFSKK
jgi:hypothetical protein